MIMKEETFEIMHFIVTKTIFSFLQSFFFYLHRQIYAGILSHCLEYIYLSISKFREFALGQISQNQTQKGTSFINKVLLRETSKIVGETGQEEMGTIWHEEGAKQE